MHPQNIVDDFKNSGASFVLENGELFLENQKDVIPEAIEFTKHYKKRIITYLEGDYSKEVHSVKSTIDKIVSYMIGEDNAANDKISDWLINDYEVVQQIITLMQIFYDAGWNTNDPIANYENSETDILSKKIFDRAMKHFGKVVKN